MKKLLATSVLAAIALLTFATAASAEGYATNTLHPLSQIETGDTVTITDSYGAQRLLCFSDSGPCPDGNTVTIATSPETALNALTNLNNFLAMTTPDFDNITAFVTENDQAEPILIVTAVSPGTAGQAIQTSASFAEGGGWLYPNLYYDSGSLDPVKSGRILTATVGTLSDVLGTSVYPVLAILGALIGLGYLLHFVYDQVGPSVGGSVSRADDALAENKRIMQRIHDKWPGHDDHSSYV